MQRLRGRGWVKAFELPDAPRTVPNLLEKGWIEQQGDGLNLAYQITDQGMEAKTAPVPIRR